MVLTTSEAFGLLTTEMWDSLTKSEKTRLRQIKHRVNNGGVSSDLIEKELQKHGFEVIQEKIWKIKTKNHGK